jgi:hypothetical protein
MNLDFLSSISIKSVYASTLLSGLTTCGITVCGVTVKGTTISGTTVCGGIVCASTCFTGSGAGLTGTASSLTVGCATNANCAVNSACLGGQLPSYYAPIASPAFTTCITAPIACISSCVRSPLISGGTVCGNTCVCSPAVYGTKIYENGTCLASTYLGCCATAANSLGLCGCTPNCFTNKSIGLTGATNGLSTTSNVVKLGGRLTECTHLEGGYCFDINAVQGFNVRTSGNTDINIDAQNCGGFILKSQCGSVNTFPDFTNAVGFYGNIDQPSGFAIYDCRATATGIVYNADYSANYVSRSLVDKAYVDSVATGLNIHAAVIVATTVDITLSANQTIDGVLTTTGMRVLVKNQATAANNGIYSASTSTWGRTSDYDNSPSGEITNGDLIPVTSGSTQNSSIWVLTTPNPIVVNVTPLTFSEFSTVLDISAGNGINVVQTGGVHNISVQLASNCGLTFCGSGLAVNPNIAGTDLSYTNGVLAVCASCFLGATACAADSAKLNNQSASYYAPIDSPNFTTCICAPVVCATSKININSPTSTTRDLNVGANGINTYGNIQMAIDCYFFIGPATDNGTRFKLFTNSCHAYFDFYDCLMFRSGPSSSTIIATISSGGTITACNCFAGSGAGLTGTAISLKSNDSCCLNGQLASYYAQIASPNFTTNACAPIFLGSTCVCGAIVCSNTCILAGTCVTGTIMCASSCVKSPLISGGTVCGLTSVTSPIIFGTSCICTNTIICAGTCVSTSIVCASTCIKSPIISGSTCATATLVCGACGMFTTCVCSPIVCAGACFAVSHATSPYLVISKTNATARSWYIQAITDYLYLGCTSTCSLCIDTSANIVTPGNGTAADWIATSDCRLKTNIQPLNNSLSIVQQLCGVNYQLCDDEKHECHLGLIAQDVQKVLPEIVSHSIPDENDAKYGITDEKLGLKYDKLSAVLIEAIKEQQVQILNLETEINNLKQNNIL